MPRPIDARRRGRCRAQLGLGVAAALLAACAVQAPQQPANAPSPAASATPPPPPPASVPAPPPSASAPLSAPATPAPPPRGETADQVARQFIAASERLRGLPTADLVREVVRLSESPQQPATTIEMAIGLGLTRSPGDVARAIGLLDPIARSSSPDLAPWQPWARLLLARYQEQRRVEDQVERQAQQLREQQRRIDQLNNQVEALKAIERSMAPRPSQLPPAVAPRGGPP